MQDMIWRDGCSWRVGAALSAADMADSEKRALACRQLSSITCENDMKPERLLDRDKTLALRDPARAAIDLTVAAPYLDMAAENGIPVRAHTLVWHNQTPRWFFAEGFSDAEDAPQVDAELMEKRMRHYIADVMEAVNARWPGVVYAWDVVNEAIEPDNGHERGFRMRKSGWYQTMGENFVEKAFDEARRHATPGQKLFYNDYLTFLPEKRAFITALLQRLLARALVDGMGMQMHIHPELPDMALFEEAARSYGALGLTIHLTEMDVNGVDASAKCQDLLAARYRQVTDSVVRLRAEGVDIESVTLWGLTDANSWLTKRDRHCYPMLFDALGRGKPALAAMIPGAEILAAREGVEPADGPDALSAGMRTVEMPGGQLLAAAVPGSWQCVGDVAEAAGGILVRYWSPSAFRVRIALDAPKATPCAAVEVPASYGLRSLVLPLDNAVPAGHRAYTVFSDGGVMLEALRLIPERELAVGENPIIPMDFPDPDVIRVDDTYYMVTTTMHMLPGCAILSSKDLIHWDWCARVFDTLEDTPGQRLENGGVYGKGMWAASLRYHKGTFHIVFVANDTHKTYLFRAEDIRGSWRRSEIAGFYHDCSLLFDDDGRVYLAHGNRTVRLTELDADLTGPKPGGLERVLIDFGPAKTLGYEGSHLYKIGGRYHLFVIHSLPDRWRRVESCFSADSLEGEFKGGIVFDDDMGVRPDGIAQGAIVDTPDGRWYAVLFQDVGAAGRMPYLLPMAWEFGRPVIGLNGKAPRRVANLASGEHAAHSPLCGSDNLTGALHPAWEWNHMPDLALAHWGGGALRVTTGRVDRALTDVRNMLTQRAILPGCEAEVTVDAAALHEGDTAGLCVLQGLWGYVGLRREADGTRIILATREAEDGPEGVIRASIPWQGTQAILRLTMRFSPEKDEAAFAVLREGVWEALGQSHTLRYGLDHFMGARFGLFAMAGETAGGTAAFTGFTYRRLEE